LNLPASLEYFENEDLKHVPAWAAYYFAIGKLASSLANESSRYVIAIAVPTRAYCASLIALGAVTDQADKNVHRSKAEHFSMLCDLPSRTSVTIRVKNRLQQAIICGKEMNEDGKTVKYLRIKPKKGQVRLINQSQSHNVKVASKRTELKERQTGQLVEDNSAFSKHFFAENAAEHGALGSSKLCAVVGIRRYLEHEFTQQRFSVKTEKSDAAAEGTLQDVIKVRSIGKDSEQFLAAIFSPNEKARKSPTQPVAETVSQNAPVSHEEFPVVVFDGANAYLKQHENWKGQNSVVVLDRTDNRFEDAVDELNRQFMGRVVKSDVLNTLEFLPDAPPGVEIQLSEVKRCSL